MHKFGLLGKSLPHSLSPQIHQIIFETTAYPGTYELIEKDDITNIADLFKQYHLTGLNVTIPYKETVFRQLNHLTEEATAIGAVNTLYMTNNQLTGTNTDYDGFGAMLTGANISLTAKTVIILGTGGSSKTVAHFAKNQNATAVHLISRTPKANQFSYDQLDAMDFDILINTTPVGMYPNVGISPVDESIIKKADVLVDLIYNPEETEFLRLGRKHERVCCNGLLMLIGQAIKAEEIWQKRTFTQEEIRTIYEAVKEAMNHD